MHRFALIFALHFGAAEPSGDRWFAPDKAKHFFSAAFVECLSFSALRTTGMRKSYSLGGAVGAAGAVSIGKEVYDLKFGGDPSFKDLTWDGAGMLAATALLRRTEP